MGLSVDGPRHLHDAYRLDKGGKPTFDRVMRGLDHLRAHGVNWNVLTTLHDANAGHAREIYTFQRDDCGAQHMQFIPIVERTDAHTLPWPTKGGDSAPRTGPCTGRKATGSPPGR